MNNEKTDNEIMAANMVDVERRLLLSLRDKPQTWPQILAKGFTVHNLDGLWLLELVTINRQDEYRLTTKGRCVALYVRQPEMKATTRTHTFVELHGI